MTKLTFTKAENIKLALMMQYRYARSCTMTSTECGRNSADVLIIEKNKLIEFEVKVSIEDLKADFRKDKHNYYVECKNLTEWNRNFDFTPHYFYFAIPESLVSKALPLFMGKPYGVVAVPDIPFKPNIHWIKNNKYLKVVKNASLLRSFPVTDNERDEFLKRMSSELIRAKISIHENKFKEIKHDRQEINED